MHITQVISHYVPAHRFGGPLQVAHGLGKALVRLGHSVSVCTTNLADETTDLDAPTDRPVNVDGVLVHYSPTCCSRYWGFSPQLWRAANAEVAKADLALVHFHYQFANWAGAKLARRHNTPYALFAHGSFKTAAISRKGRWKKRLYLALAERGNLHGAKWLLFNAREEKRESLYAKRGNVLPNGVDLEEFATVAPDSFRDRYPQLKDKLTILFLGRIDYSGKGLDQFLPAFQQFLQANPDSHLVLAGPDERGGRAQTEALVKQLGMQQHVTFTGLLRGDERIAALRECDAYVLPSPSEGLSIALLEALYVGIPVVVTQGVGLSDQVATTGAGVVTQTDTASLLTGLNAIATCEARTRMRGRATELVRQSYSWNAIATQLLELTLLPAHSQMVANRAPSESRLEAST